MRVLCTRDIQFGPIRPSSGSVEKTNSTNNKPAKKNNNGTKKDSGI